ncbi:GCN5-related N-acetyltransferase [Nocardioides sp. JS614]|nr:GCN5-related N-acetyltransferase [Nocardioides sp. JS614]
MLDKFSQLSLVILRNRLTCGPPLRLAGHTSEATKSAAAGRFLDDHALTAAREDVFSSPRVLSARCNFRYKNAMVRLRVDDSAAANDGAAVWPMYKSVFGDYSDYETWHGAVWGKHSVRNGFRLARAYDADVLVGFAYGYTGEHGQWWTDNALRVLEHEVADAWLGGHFELVSIGVLDTARRRGIGRGLMHVLLEGLPHERLLLMTSSDPSDPARRLYASEGWHVLGPGIGDGTVIMGRRTGDPPTV